jgi:hypothetical protein
MAAKLACGASRPVRARADAAGAAPTAVAGAAAIGAAGALLFLLGQPALLFLRLLLPIIINVQ